MNGLTDNEIVQALDKLYVTVAAMNGYVTELTKLIDENLAKIDALGEAIHGLPDIEIDKSLYVCDEDSKNTVTVHTNDEGCADCTASTARKEVEEHLGNNGDECNGCNECGGPDPMKLYQAEEIAELNSR